MGYELQVSEAVCVQASLGAELAVFVHHVLREDASDLYGFANYEEKRYSRP